MGREIRRVPANWEHPKTRQPNGTIDYQPMFQYNYEDSLAEWNTKNELWKNKTHPDYDSKYTYEEWSGEKPCKNYYIPYKEEDATWYQAYETVSEGTPVSPPFSTEDELITYLYTHGDFWDQRRGDVSWSLEAATNFVKGDRFRPTMMIANGVIKMSKDM